MKKLLIPLSFIYKILIKLRSLFYYRGILSSSPSTIPSICVGNVCVGGNGKTPLAIYLAQEFLNTKNLSIISRGYGGTKNSSQHIISSGDTDKNLNDETLIYQELFSDGKINIINSKNRIKAIELAKTLGSNLVILDDGLQHLKLKPTISLCLIDLEDSHYYLNNTTLLPAGIFREPPQEGIQRSSRIVFIKRCKFTEIDQKNLFDICKKFSIEKYSCLQISASDVLDAYNKEKLISQNENIIATCSIAKPNIFKNNLSDLNFNINNFFIFPDHYNYTYSDWIKIKNTSKESKIICTLKDAVKLKSFIKEPNELFYLSQKIEDISSEGNALIPWLKSRLIDFTS